MSQEILFTSSKRGLRAGSTGFCTVRSTVGMPQNLASLLEQLTGYTHPYDAYDRRLFDKHPVNFAHYISRVGGQRFHILCRICNAPLDHTNRSNKLAHLIAFEEGEIDLAHTQGPAAAISWMIPPSGQKQKPGDSRYWITSWPSDQEPCVLPDSNRLVLPSVNDKPGPCTVWKQILGDSGWAAVLAESVQDRKRQSVPVVFSSDQKDKCLDLVQEALSLLPPAERWGVTFSTFQSGSLPTKVECRWQFLLDSTDLAQKALRNEHRTPVIDLTSLTGMQSPASELASFTNSGKRLWDRASVSLSRPVAPQQPAPAPSKRSSAPVPATDEYDDDNLDSAAGGYTLRARASRPAARPGRAAPGRRNRKPRPSRQLMAAAGAIIVLGGTAMWGLPHLSTKQNDDSTELTETRISNKDQAAGTDKLPDNDSSPITFTSPETSKVQPEKPATPRSNNAIASLTRTLNPLPTDSPALGNRKDESEDTPKPFYDLRDMRSQIPKLLVQENARKRQSPVILSANIDVDSPLDCEITLTHNDAVKHSGFRIKLDRKDRDEKSQWAVTGKGPGDLGRGKDIGVFTVDEKTLSFHFSKNPQRPMPDVFLETAIRISHTRDKDEPVICWLGHPDDQPPLRLTNTNREKPVDLLENNRIGTSKDQLVLRCEIVGLPEEYQQKTKFELLNTARKNEILFTREAKIGDATVTHVDIKVSLIDTDEGNIAVQCKQFIKYVAVDFNKVGQYSFDYSYDEFNESTFKKNVEKAKKNLGEGKQNLKAIQDELNTKKEALAKTPKKQTLKNEVDMLSLAESRAIDAVTFATDWIAWSTEVARERGELIKNVTINYEFQRNNSVPEDEQAILVQSGGLE